MLKGKNKTLLVSMITCIRIFSYHIYLKSLQSPYTLKRKMKGMVKFPVQILISPFPVQNMLYSN